MPNARRLVERKNISKIFSKSFENKFKQFLRKSKLVLTTSIYNFNFFAMVKKLLKGLAIPLAFLCSCSSDDFSDEPINIDLTRSEANAVDAVNDFAFDLIKAAEKRFGEEMPNYFISPQSAAWCLSMLANGAEEGSETLREMTDALHLGADASLQDVNDYCSKLIAALDSRSNDANLAVANAVYYRDYIGIKSSFINSLRKFYNAEELKNHTNSMIDSWVSNKTGGMIPNFASKFDLEKLDFGVLNSTFFSAKWLSDFKPDKWKKDKFRNADGTYSYIDMLYFSQSKNYMSDDEVCYLLKMCFENSSFAICFILPKDRHDIGDVLDHLDGTTWRNLVNNKYSKFIEVKFPELNISSDFDFVDVIQDMGVRRIFSSESELVGIADFKVRMSQFDQSNVLRLDEKGVTASSASHAGGLPTAVGPESFYMDEPFYYFITEESTGAILYAGKISQVAQP